MDNKQTLMTAGFVGVGSVALAYFGHSYLTNKDKPVTEMEKASDTVDKSSFFDFIFGDSSNDKTDVTTNDVTTNDVKKNVKIELNRFSTDPVVEGEAIKATVGKAIGSFSGFFRQDDDKTEKVDTEKN